MTSAYLESGSEEFGLSEAPNRPLRFLRVEPFPELTIDAIQYA